MQSQTALKRAVGEAVRMQRVNLEGRDTAHVFRYQKGHLQTTVTVMPPDPLRTARVIIETGALVAGDYMTLRRDGLEASPLNLKITIQQTIRKHFEIPAPRRP